MGVSPKKTRSDITPKSQPSKASQKNEEYLKYKNYIRSKAFKAVKQAVEERDGYKCMTCGRTRSDGAKLTCHHRTYDHLFEGGENEIADCITLCQYCHKGIHSIRSNYQRFRNKSKKDNNDEETTIL